MTIEDQALRYATAQSFVDWLSDSMADHLVVIDGALDWRIKAKTRERKRFDELVAVIRASGLISATAAMREKMANNPVGRIGDYDGYDLNAVRCGLDDALRCMIHADLTAADQAIGRCVDKLESILKRKRESVTPNRRITTMQRKVVTNLRDEVAELRVALVRVMARVSEPA